MKMDRWVVCLCLLVASVACVEWSELQLRGEAVGHAQLAKLNQANPRWFTASGSKTSLPSELPLPNGQLVRVRLHEYEASVSAASQGMRTYFVRGTDDLALRGSLTVVNGILHGSLTSPNIQGGARVLIDPMTSHARALGAAHSVESMPYASFYQTDYPRGEFQCLNENHKEHALGKAFSPLNLREAKHSRRSSATVPGALTYGSERKTLRLALSATAQYGEQVSGVSTGDPTYITLTAAAQLVAVNRINEVFLNEFSITVALIANNNDFISDDENDALSSLNDDGGSLLDQNPLWLQSKGASESDYDIGHVFSTGGGGIAGLGVACNGQSSAAGGVTGSADPTGDAFYIDYVAHEMGHQFGGEHTFNSEIGSCGGGNRSPDAAVEPGSGISIMAYAGICGADDLAPHSLAQYSWYSLSQCTSTLNTCPAGTSNPGEVTVETLAQDMTIPPSTPFILTGSASATGADATLSYSWEESDTGVAASLAQGDVGSNPLFRPFLATSFAERLFVPGDAIGDINPTTSRDLTFRLTARDNLVTGGHFAISDAVVTVSVDSEREAFVVAPVDTSYDVGDTVSLQWTTSNSDLSSQLCVRFADQVALDDGAGLGYCVGTVAHDGTFDFVIPDGSAAGSAVLYVVGQTPNYFFSYAAFTIGGSTGSGYVGEACSDACEISAVAVAQNSPANLLSASLLSAF